jgi:mRNA interferase RelE/StbE
VKSVTYTPQALKALAQHRNHADRIVAKVRAYAEKPASQANNIKRLKGTVNAACRLRVGDYRVIFEETDTTITVLRLGPRGSIYD